MAGSSFGNIFKNNIEEILNSPKFITFNDKIKKGIMPSELCQKCDFKKRLNKQSVW